MENTIITIVAGNEEKLKIRLETLSKKAQRLGVLFPTITFSDPIPVRYYDADSGRYHYVYYVDVTLTGEGISSPVSYGDWEILGAYNHQYDTGVIINLLSDEVNPKFTEKFNKYNVSHCDHCNKTLKRKNTYVIQHSETKKQILVGSACMADYVPMKKSVDDIIHYYSSFKELFMTLPSDFRDSHHFDDTDDFLSSVLSVLTFGITNYDEQFWPIVSNIHHRHFLGDTGHYSQQIFEKYFEKSKELLPELIEYVKSLSDENSFDLKLKRITLSPYHLIKDQKVLIWSAIKFLNFKQKQLELSCDKNEYLGEIKDSIKAKVKFVSERFLYSGAYGDSYLYIFKTEDGNTITWKTTKRDFELHNEYEIKGTIKELTEFNNIKQTQLTRLKVLCEY